MGPLESHSRRRDVTEAEMQMLHPSEEDEFNEETDDGESKERDSENNYVPPSSSRSLAGE
eukprot:scaffold1704_cov246-Pinguiococcus_pyrenoidosus.AAC.9